MKRCSRKIQRKKSIKRTRQKRLIRRTRRMRSTRRTRLTKKYKAGGLSDWWSERKKQKLEEQLLKKLNADLLQKKEDLTFLFNKIKIDQKLDWVMDLNVTQGKCISDGEWKPGFVFTPLIGSEFTCLKISDQKYDKNNLLENIWDFFRLKQKILKLELYEQVSQPTDEDEFNLYTQIQVIVEEFVKLHEAHKTHLKFLKYISEKIPENLEHLYLEDKYHKKELEDLSKKHNLLLKINQILPDKFRLNTGELCVYDKTNNIVPDDLFEAIEPGKYNGLVYGAEHGY